MSRGEKRESADLLVPAHLYGLRRGTTSVLTAVCVLFAIFVLAPLVWLLINATKNQANVYGITGTRPNATFTYAPPYPLLNNNVGYQQPLTSPQEMNAELAKVRYRFSDATSLGFEFFGTQATLDPEGAAFGQFVGYAS